MSDSENTNGYADASVKAPEKGEAPLRAIRDGSLSSSIWPRQNDEGETFYTAKIVRNYRDNEGKFHETNSYSESDLRRLPDLARNTSDIMTALRHDQQLARDVQIQRRTELENDPHTPAQEAYQQKRIAQANAAPKQKQGVKNKPVA